MSYDSRVIHYDRKVLYKIDHCISAIDNRNEVTFRSVHFEMFTKRRNQTIRRLRRTLQSPSSSS